VGHGYSLAGKADATLTPRAYAATVLTVAMLGPVELCRDGARLAVPAGKTTELLIRLALEAGVHVRTDRLIDELWSAQASGVARNTVQAKVSKLRRVLGDADLLTGDRSGYRLHIDPARVDALEVLRVAEAGFGSAGAEPVRRATAEALTAFRGELPSFDWFAPYRLRLDEARLRLTEDHLGARLALGADAELVGELETLVAAHPWREELWRLLITALYRADRQADALAAYARVRRTLADDLGIDPGPGLQALETRILRQDAALAPPRGNLPARSASLVGRAADVTALTALVRAEPLVTVVGPAGVGKTRLALEVAPRLPGRLAGPAGRRHGDLAGHRRRVRPRRGDRTDGRGPAARPGRVAGAGQLRTGCGCAPRGGRPDQRTADSGHQSGAAGRGRRTDLFPIAVVPPRFGGPLHRTRGGAAALVLGHTRTAGGGLPFAGRLAAGHRAGGGAGESTVH
jgi:DNA-binding SARP family transcriptional activator